MTSHQCPSCDSLFEIDQWQIDFLSSVSPKIGDEIVSLPPPTHCPLCRLQRRLAFRNQIYVAHTQGTSASDTIFSMFPGNTKYPVIQNKLWWDEEGWRPEEYGVAVDFSQPFFPQWVALRDRVPRPAINGATLENSDYSNNCGSLKNCYFCFDIGYAEDCMFVETAQNCKDCFESSMLLNSELCYDCVACVRCYNLQSSDSCTDCSESLFLLNCRSCRNCFGCVNLRQKEFCIYNKQCSREEYFHFLKTLNLSSYQARLSLKKKIVEFFRKNPHPHFIGTRIENSTGNHLDSSRNIDESFFVSKSEDSKFLFVATSDTKNCMDYTIWGERAELIYESVVCGIDVQRLLFCFNCWMGSHNLIYCDSCHGSSYCFGSVSVRKRSHIILNKSYTKHEYEGTAKRLVAHMQETGEWGEFFPLWSSLHPYNLSLAQRHFPLTPSECKEIGAGYYEIPPPLAAKVVTPSELPDLPPASDDSITTKSATSGRPFRITGAEIRKCRSFNVPLPRTTYDERMNVRAQRAGSIRLHSRQCAKSGKELNTSYTAEEYPIIWDKDLYEAEMA